MKRALLDVNVLIALLDAEHAHHHRAKGWFLSEVEHGWASCAITQNGFVRVISQPRYPSPLPPALAIERLGEAAAFDRHEFWPCDRSILDAGVIDRTRIHGPRQLTDAYLLALAVSRGGRFATFDRTVALAAVVGATADHLCVV